jgi:hypothetical protein
MRGGNNLKKNSTHLTIDTFMMDAATNTTTATANSGRLAAEEDAGTAAVEDQLIEGERLVCSKYNKILAMKDGKGSCHEHGKRKRCEFLGCENFAQRKGLCLTHGKALHGYDRKKCTTPGCSTNAVMGGHCKAHGGKRLCMIEGCGRSLFQEKMCRFHYRATKGKSGSDWEPSITRVMGMVGWEVVEYLGINKNRGEIHVDCGWDDVFAISGVCQSWREAYIDYLNWIKPKIGLMPTLGFSERKLNVYGFLSYLAEDDRFRSATTIYVPCGKAERLLYRDVKARCRAMTKLIHRSWLMVNGDVEYGREGQGRHQCYCVYKHDKEYIEGETTWIKYAWDGKYEKVHEQQLVQLEQLVPRRRRTKPTNFYRG